MKRRLTTKEDFKQFITENNIQSPKALCNILFEPHVRTLSRKIKQNLCRSLDMTKEYPYYHLYKNEFLLPKMITKYYKGIPKQQVDRALILEVGKSFPDGFSGVRIKARSYTSNYVIEFLDGERGTLFLKQYNHFPAYEELIMDSLLESSIHEPPEYFDFSIVDLF